MLVCWGGIGPVEPVKDVNAKPQIVVSLQAQNEGFKEEQQYKQVFVPSHIEFKPYMDFRAVTDTSSKQYKLLSKAKADKNGLMRIGSYYCIALGSKFGPVGTKYKAIIGGKEYKLIKCDEKMAKHTKNQEGYLGQNGHLVEMIVRTESLPSGIRTSGNCNALMQGKVEQLSIERKKTNDN